MLKVDVSEHIDFFNHVAGAAEAVAMVPSKIHELPGFLEHYLDREMNPPIDLKLSDHVIFTPAI